MNRLLAAMTLLLPVLPAYASGAGGMFGQGRTQVSVVGGNGYAFGKNYFIIGARVSYYVLDGLGVGLSYENWSQSNPSITKYAPYVQQVFYQSSSFLQPYIGGVLSPSGCGRLAWYQILRRTRGHQYFSRAS